MQIRIFQIIVPLIAAVFIIGLATGYRKGKLNLRELLLSIIFWIGAACLALFPDVISNFVAEVFGIKSNVNAVIFLSIGVIVYIQFVLYAEIKRNRRLLTTLTRELALRDAKKETGGMKILFVLEHYYPYIGGAETLFQLLTEALAEHHEVRVITTRFQHDLPAQEIRQGVDIRRINCRNRFLFSVVAVPAVIRSARWADVVHTTTYNAALPAWIGAKVAGKKVIVTFHEVWGALWTQLPFLSRPAAWAFRLFERMLLWLPFDRYVAVSEFTARTLVQYGVDKSKVVRIYNGLNYADFSDYDHQPPAQFTYTYFGRLGVSKGLELLIPAAATFRDRHPDSRLRLIIPRRPAAMFRTITDLIDHHQLSDYVELLHELPISELRRQVSTSSCVVIPSYSEGFCFVAAEAVAMDVPVVSSGQGALVETVSGRHVTMAAQTIPALVDALDLAFQEQWTKTTKASYPLNQSVREYEAFYGSLRV